MSTYDLGLLVHLVGVLLFFSGLLLAGASFEAARRRGRPSEVALLLGLTRVGALFVAAGVLLIFAGGSWLAHQTDQFGAAWLRVSLGLFLVSIVLGAFGGQRPKRARRLATRLADDQDEMTIELRRFLDDPVSLAVNYAASILALIVLVLMIWRPGR